MLLKLSSIVTYMGFLSSSSREGCVKGDKFQLCSTEGRDFKFSEVNDISETWSYTKIQSRDPFLTITFKIGILKKI